MVARIFPRWEFSIRKPLGKINLRYMKRSRLVTDPQEQNAPVDESCPFCKIAAHEIEAKIILEDQISVAFLDVRPLFPGHVLLIPKAHYSTLLDLPADLVGPFFINAQKLARKVQDAMKAEGSFVAINNVVSQSVPHLHVHIVPRKRKDGLRGFFWPRRQYQGEEMVATHEALSAPPKPE
jgi:histidine triad (HIT) family protein